MDCICKNMNDHENEHIRFIISQTNYNIQTAQEKLVKHNGNHIDVIKEYMGIPIKIPIKQIKSINQEIYKQIRTKLDTTMREYNNKNPINTEDVISKFQQYNDK